MIFYGHGIGVPLLNESGLEPLVASWIHDSLSNRQQPVQVGGEASSTLLFDQEYFKVLFYTPTAISHNMRHCDIPTSFYEEILRYPPLRGFFLVASHWQHLYGGKYHTVR